MKKYLLVLVLSLLVVGFSNSTASAQCQRTEDLGEGSSIITEGSSIVIEGATPVVVATTPKLVFVNDYNIESYTSISTDLAFDTRVKIIYTRDRNDAWKTASEFGQNEFGGIRVEEYILSVFVKNMTLTGLRVYSKDRIRNSSDLIFDQPVCLNYDKVYRVTITSKSFLRPLSFNIKLNSNGRVQFS